MVGCPCFAAYISVTSASSLPCLAVQWSSLNMDISPILVFLSYPTVCDRIVVLSNTSHRQSPTPEIVT